MITRRLSRRIAALGLALATAGCASQVNQAAVGTDAETGSARPSSSAESSPSPTRSPAPATENPDPVARPSGTAAARQENGTGSGEITLTVPDAGIRDLRVLRYRGTPDDGPGTEINERGLGAAPFGDWGGVMPGQVGNFIVTGHRTSAGAPMLRVPDLKPGAEIIVRQGAKTIRYRAASRLWVNFRSASDRALQQAAIPGKPGARATRPAIVLSTCATPEDNADGLMWRDGHGNPTHRIAIVGYAI